jgi:hypothetical protein
VHLSPPIWSASCTGGGDGFERHLAQLTTARFREYKDVEA